MNVTIHMFTILDTRISVATYVTMLCIFVMGVFNMVIYVGFCTMHSLIAACSVATIVTWVCSFTVYVINVYFDIIWTTERLSTTSTGVFCPLF